VGIRARFGAVLLLQFGLLCWLVAFGHSRDSGGLLDLTGVVIPLCGVAVVTDRKWQRLVAFGLAGLAMAFSGGALSGVRPNGLDVGPGLSALFSAYATWFFLRKVVRSKRVTGDVLAGALAGYIMAGLAFAVVYGVIANQVSGAFSAAGSDVASFPDLVYFSFVTLLTIGFGDVAPVAPVARAVVLAEGIFGVVYTTIVMAALVAAYLRHSEREDAA